ncbi:MAG: alpha/beta hydrolase [Spirochaetae bacterium HGW-Spirochaetae-8]|nr:MAG: alpha/beta hydrolase [Spirochaetae bacterium HGW-Spirochaetae-8]
MRLIGRSFSSAVLVLVISLILVSAISCSSYTPLSSSSDVQDMQTEVSKVDAFITVLPLEATRPDTALVFYPGALVEPEAYIPIARAIAGASGMMVVIVPMPLDLAVLAPQRGMAVLARFPEITHWYAAGHSLGGAMAAALVAKNPDSFAGLVFMAAYPAKSTPLVDTGVPVLSLYAQFDGLATLEKIEASKALLPPDTWFLLIEGGNHAGFGDYGPQKNDGQAIISASEQWSIVAKAIAQFIE